MALNQHEQEIFDRIKAFLRTYGLPIGLGLVISLGSVLAWNGYGYYQLKQQESATDIYQRFSQLDNAYKEILAERDTNSLNESGQSEPSNNKPSNDTGFQPDPNRLGEENSLAVTNSSALDTRIILIYNQMAEIATVLQEKFSSQTYTAFAAMRIAAIDAMNGDINEATSRLQWVVQNASSDNIVSLASVILSRSLLSEGKYDEALSILNSRKFTSLDFAQINELRGDIYYEQGNYKEAKALYEKSLSQGGESSILRYKLLLMGSSVQ